MLCVSHGADAVCGYEVQQKVAELAPILEDWKAVNLRLEAATEGRLLRVISHPSIEQEN